MKKNKCSSNTLKYHSSNPLKRFLLERFLQRLVAQIDTIQTSSFLDVGCGEGFVARRILAKHSFSYSGVDISESAVSMARQQNPTGNFQHASAYTLPFEDNQFDTAICTEVLEHLDEPQRAVQELCRVTKGTILFSVPNEPFFRIGNLLGLSHLSRLGNPPDHVNLWNIKTFTAFLSPWVDIQHIEKPFPWQMVTAKPLNASKC